MRTLRTLHAVRHPRRWTLTVMVVCRLMMGLTVTLAVPVELLEWHAMTGALLLTCFGMYVLIGVAERLDERIVIRGQG